MSKDKPDHLTDWTPPHMREDSPAQRAANEATARVVAARETEQHAAVPPSRSSAKTSAKRSSAKKAPAKKAVAKQSAKKGAKRSSAKKASAPSAPTETSVAE